MIREFLRRANAGGNVYITEVIKAFDGLSRFSKAVCVLETEYAGEARYTVKLPVLSELNGAEEEFVRRYFYARVYNILSTLGGVKMAFYADTADGGLVKLIKTLDGVFDIGRKRSERSGYGKCVNVIERMNADKGGTFSFEIRDIGLLGPEERGVKSGAVSALGVFQKAARGLTGKILCGMDIGGTDIKIAVSRGSGIVCFKEYDWFPAKFTDIRQLIDPIVLLVRLVRAKVSLDACKQKEYAHAAGKLERAMDRNAGESDMQEAVLFAESLLGDRIQLFDGIGMCFPDVVVRDKIVGGEVYKTRGIRECAGEDYEKQFKKLTDLDTLLYPYCRNGGKVCITNDGPMAAFTAAVEISASDGAEDTASGVFAHTLGTELGTGWIDENGAIPDIPLEVYNYVIDLGNGPAMAYHADDLRSVNNFNTGLSGTLQKYTSQSGVFRLAVRYFKEQRPDLYTEIFRKGFVQKDDGAGEGLYLQTEPVDKRKAFLEYMMELAEKGDCEICREIFREIGEYLAVTWEETEDILHPRAKSRVLFGRLVKKPACFELMLEGARRIVPDIRFAVADGEMANTVLMRQLKENRMYTVAQFAQAVGAIYYVNLHLQE
jgi:hypothetical protein